MLKLSERSAILATYPRNCTFAELLHWHLYSWGTRPTGEPKRWEDKQFFKAVFGPILDEDSANKNLKHWLGKGAAPDAKYYPAIVEALFSQNPELADWRIDFQLAQQHSRKWGNDWSPPKLPIAYGARFDEDNSKANHFAAAARENVELLLNRLDKNFAGRADDLALITEFVEARMAGGKNGLLIITAPPGVGKSALAAHWCSGRTRKPNQWIARHLCSLSHGRATTSLEQIYAHLHYQVTEAFGQPVDHRSRDLDSLVSLLKSPVPNDGELIIWLDGIDEADGKVECFLPATLGKGICVIISARANERTIPEYLEPWLKDAMAVSHHPVRHSLQNLSQSEIGALVDAIFKEIGLGSPTGLSWAIFRASCGLPLFARAMAETAAEATAEGRTISLGEMPESLLGYIKKEVQRLESLENWGSLIFTFSLLATAWEALRVDDLTKLLGKPIFIGSIPRPMLRWLTIVEEPHSLANPLLSFAHPLLADAFEEALGSFPVQAIEAIYVNLKRQSFTEWPRYALEHLPGHFIEVERLDLSEKLLLDVDFIFARYQSIEVFDFASLMTADWSLLRADHELPLYDEETDMSEPARQMRFWKNFPNLILHPSAPSFQINWHQLVHNVRVFVGEEYAPAGDKRLDASDYYLTSLINNRSENLGVLALPEGSGFLVWNDEGTLRLLNSRGAEQISTTAHNGRIYGAIALESGGGYVTWGADGTIRLWGSACEKGLVLQGYNDRSDVLASNDGKSILSFRGSSVLRFWDLNCPADPKLHDVGSYAWGALALEDKSGFLTWHFDGKLRLWSPSGILRAVLAERVAMIDGAIELQDSKTIISWGHEGQRTITLWELESGYHENLSYGHRGPITGGLALKSDSRFLTWSEDCTLQLWGRSGDEIAVFRGHTSRVWGALVLEENAGFLSWSWHEILLWGPEGDERKMLYGHERWISGAIALRKDAGYVSWSHNEIILWTIDGELANIWLYPSLTLSHIEKVYPCGEPHRYLVHTGNELFIIHLPPLT